MIVVAPLLLVVLALAFQRSRRGTPALAANLPGYIDDPAVEWTTARALARFEAGRLVRHPAFLVGLALTPLALWAATSNPSERFLWRAQSGIALGLVPLGWSAIFATNLATLRARRHGSTELLRTVPTTPSSLTAGHVGSALALVPVTVVLIALWMVVEVVVFDAAGSFDVLEFLTPVVIVAGGAVVGVAVARYLPAAPFAFAAFFVVTQLQVMADDIGGPDAVGSGPGMARHLAFLVSPLSVGDPALELRRPGWHAVYLLGATVVLVGVVLARHGATRLVAVVVGVGLVLAVGGAGMESRPLSSEQVAAMVSRLSEPERHQRCTSHGSTEYCSYPQFTGAVDEWREKVDSVLVHVPAAAREGRQLRVQQRTPTRVGNEDCAQAHLRSQLHREVAQRIDPAVVWARDGAVHPGFAWPDQKPCGGPSVGGLFIGVQTGAWAVGLPPAVWGDHVRCRADGEARAVVALWLGAHAGDKAPKALADIARDEGALEGDHLRFPRRRGSAPSWDSPPMWGVEWHRADAEAAVRLLDEPDGRVTPVLEERWAEWTAPGTPSSALLDAVGVRSPASVMPTPVATSSCG